MPEKKDRELPVTAYLVLALIAEGAAHGYELEQEIQHRGFRFWTNIRRSSIYGSLKKLEALGFVSSSLQEGEGPARKVFRITRKGKRILHTQSLSFLSSPDHPRNEIDLGVLALPFMELDDAQNAVNECIECLKGRLSFLEEREKWCRDLGLDLITLVFERPLFSVRADIAWLEKLRGHLNQRESPYAPTQWRSYVYKTPSSTDE